MKKIISLVLVATLALSLSVVALAEPITETTDAGVYLQPLTDNPPWPPPEREGLANFDGLWFGIHEIDLDAFSEVSRARTAADVTAAGGTLGTGEHIGLGVDFVRNFTLTLAVGNFYIGTPGPANIANAGSAITFARSGAVVANIGNALSPTSHLAYLPGSATFNAGGSAQTFAEATGLVAGTAPYGSPNEWAANFGGTLTIPAGQQSTGHAQADKLWTMLWGGGPTS